MDWNDYENFQEDEFLCRCGCGRADMNPVFMETLQAMRTKANFPFRVNSGFRCPDYNEKISSTGRTGPHTTGHATDISVSGKQAHTVAGLAYLYGMSGIGLDQKGPHMKRFIHVDNLRTPPRPNVWTY